MPKKVCIILNPISGGGRSLKAVEGPNSVIGTGQLTFPCQSFKDAMKEINPDIELKIQYTERRGHAVELAKEYCDSGWIVVGAGGDGTLCETAQGVNQSKNSDKIPMGFVSCGGMNFFAISQGIERPKRVAELIKSGETKEITVCSVSDSKGLVADMLSVEAIHLGLAPRAIEGQDYGRTHFPGSAACLKLFAAYAVLFPHSKGNNFHGEITIYQEDGTQRVIEGKYMWICITNRSPINGEPSNDSWISWVQTKNFGSMPRFVKAMEEPFELTVSYFLYSPKLEKKDIISDILHSFIRYAPQNGWLDIMEDHSKFSKLVIEPLGDSAKLEGGFVIGVDGDNIRCQGTTTITSKKKFVKMLLPTVLKRDERLVCNSKKRGMGPVSKAVAQKKAEVIGKKEEPVDDGGIGKIKIVVGFIFTLGLGALVWRVILPAVGLA